MNHTPGYAWDGGIATDRRVSRRIAVGSSALALLGILIRSTHSQEQGKESNREGISQQMQERMEEARAFSERLRNATSTEERRKIMEERMSADRRRAIEDLKEQLSVPEREWAVIKPRLEAVYNLQHPVLQAGPGNERQRTEVQQKSTELNELLRDKAAPADQIKTRLTALRTAKEKARQELAAAQQNLRQILTLRQEALLVLNGLLD